MQVILFLKLKIIYSQFLNKLPPTSSKQLIASRRTHDTKLANLTEKKFEMKCTSVTWEWGSTVWIHWNISLKGQDLKFYSLDFNLLNTNPLWKWMSNRQPNWWLSFNHIRNQFVRNFIFHIAAHDVVARNSIQHAPPLSDTL